mgnify:CR=1 FL=1
MPTYQYQCTEGHSFEAIQRISAKAKSRCPECGAKAIRIISGGAGLIFKGSGFYITDYGKDGKGPRTDPTSPDAAPAKTEKADAPATADAPAPSAKEPKKPSKKAAKAPE